jgi:hypothetical protein
VLSAAIGTRLCRRPAGHAAARGGQAAALAKSLIRLGGGLTGRPRVKVRRWPALVPAGAAMLGLAAATACSATPSAGASPPRPAAAAAPHIADARRLLVPGRGALFGAVVQAEHGFTPADQEAAITALERKLGRKLAIDQLYVPFSAPMPVQVARWDLGHGSIPMISWAGAPANLVASGAYDARIRLRARQLRALHGPVMLRWFAEMDSTANSTNARSPASFIAAWRHIYDIFKKEGATNVRWVWSPTAFNFSTGYAPRFYPGRAYVDWIGADGYNWAPRRPQARWASLGQIFSAFYRWGIATGKPLLIGEYGVLERAPGEKARWFAQADRELRMQFPAIRAVVYFNADHDNFNWTVTTSASAFAAFRAFAADPYFGARPAA